MPPVGFAPAMIVPMVAAVWLIDGASDESEAGAPFARLWSAFSVGWWWGFGFFLACFWWLGAAFLVDADHFAWALPLGVVGLPAGLGLFPAIGFALARLIWHSGAARPLALAVGLSASEWLRAVVLTGFPWNEFGMALAQNVMLAQIAAFVGLHGLTLLAVAIFASPATLWGSPGRWTPTIVAALTLAGLLLFGAHRLGEPDPAPVAGAKIRLMQPNMSQGEDFSAENGAAIVSKYLQLSDRATSPDRSGIADVTLLIWPESAFPFILSREPGALARIVEFLRGGALLATGAARMEESAGGRRHYFNSIEVLDRDGLSSERYDKHHLVPFGEYLPLRRFFDWTGITQFVRVPGGFDPGQGSPVLRLRGLPEAIATVCYEAIFPNEWGGAREGEAAKATWIINVTDDAWFGLTAGPYQHFAQARLRAVELGLPLVRAANTGISALVDAKGRVLASAPLGAETVLDIGLPGALPPTWQSHWGSLTFAFLLAAAAVASLAARARSRR